MGRRNYVLVFDALKFDLPKWFKGIFWSDVGMAWMREYWRAVLENEMQRIYLSEIGEDTTWIMSREQRAFMMTEIQSGASYSTIGGVMFTAASSRQRGAQFASL